MNKKLGRLVDPTMGLYFVVLLVFAAAFANTGLIGMPLIRLLLGQEALFLAAIMEVVNDVLIFTVGILLIQSGCGCRLSYRSYPGKSNRRSAPSDYSG